MTFALSQSLSDCANESLIEEPKMSFKLFSKQDKKESSYLFKELKYEKPYGIECKYLKPDPKQTLNLDILVLSVDGKYPPGSAGSMYAKYISIMAINGLHTFDPDCIILDFRELDYVWGNSLLGVFQDISQFKDAEKEENEPYFPVLAVVSEKSRAFLSLVTPTGSKKPDWCFEGLDDSIVQGAKLAKEWLDY